MSGGGAAGGGGVSGGGVPGGGGVGGSDGGGGGGELPFWRAPQSAQSPPKAQMLNSEPGPPSSQVPSLWYWRASPW